MTVASTTSRISYAENGVTTVFPVPFRFLAASDLIVERIAADSSITTLVLGSDYTVAGGGLAVSGTVTRLAATNGQTLRIRRATARTQPTDYVAGDPFPAESHEAALDRVTMVAQEIGDQASDTETRALRVPVGEAATVLPQAPSRAGRYLTFGPSGEPLMASGTGADAGLRADLADPALGLGLAAWDRGTVYAAMTGGRKMQELPLITDFGAVGDYNGSTGTNDAAAFQYCINNNISARIPMDRNFLISDVLELRSNVSFIGDDFPSASDDVDDFPTSRLVFAGAGRAAMVNANPSEIINKMALANLVLTTTESSELTYIMDVNGLLAARLLWLSIENRWTNGGGIRSVKVTGQPSWLNRLVDVNVKLNDASIRHTLDCDWTDSEMIGGNYSGGRGAVWRGNGNMKATMCQFERSNSGGAGLKVSKETASNAEFPIVACAFDENERCGLEATVADSPGGALFGLMVASCVFRNPNADYDVIFDPTDAVGMYGPVFSGNVFSVSATPPLSVDTSKWDISLGDNSYVNPTWLDTHFGDTRSLLRILGRDGINLRGPLRVRDSRTFRGMTNVAALFGIGLDDAPGVLAGVLNGNLPYLGASRTAAGVAADLAFMTDNTERLRLLASGISNYADDTAAAAGGVPVGALYRTGAALKVRVA